MMKTNTNTYYWTCPKCGSNNDPGERCDCEKETILTITKLSKEGGMKNGQETSSQQQYVHMLGRYNTEGGIAKSGDI